MNLEAGSERADDRPGWPGEGTEGVPRGQVFAHTPCSPYPGSDILLQQAEVGQPGTALAVLGPLAWTLSAWSRNSGLPEIICRPLSELWAGLGPLTSLGAFPHCRPASGPSSPSRQLLPIRFVSDYGRNGFQAVCQHRLMQAMGQARQQGSGAARTFPLTQLEWKATQEKAGMALDVGCFNGELPSPCPTEGQPESAGASSLGLGGAGEGPAGCSPGERSVCVGTWRLDLETGRGARAVRCKFRCSGLSPAPAAVQVTSSPARCTPGVRGKRWLETF